MSGFALHAADVTPSFGSSTGGVWIPLTDSSLRMPLLWSVALFQSNSLIAISEMTYKSSISLLSFSPQHSWYTHFLQRPAAALISTHLSLGPLCFSSKITLHSLNSNREPENIAYSPSFTTACWIKLIPLRLLMLSFLGHKLILLVHVNLFFRSCCRTQLGGTNSCHHHYLDLKLRVIE